MMASTVLRVKRRLEENPQDALVLMCKRMKTDNEISPSLFVYRGTVKDQETANVRSVVPKTDLKLQFTSNVQDIIQKLRNERKQKSSESRYKIVNCSRALDIGEVDEQIHLVDLQKASDPIDIDAYAYDLYIAARQGFDVSMLDELISIEHYETDLLDTNPVADSSDGADDNDDSNDENNWRNEYPDSEHSSIDEQDMIMAMERVDLDNELSSDVGEDNIYESATDDVTRYGAAYARYKAKVMAENSDLNNSKGLVLSSNVKDLDESVDGYKNDSDDGFYYGKDDDCDRYRDRSDSDDDSSLD